MVTVKLLKPYYIKSDAQYVRIKLAYQYFSLLINDQLYHFVPIESNEIKIDRRTKQIVNTNANFAFQKGKDIISIRMSELVSLPDFLIQLFFIVEAFNQSTNYMNESELKEESKILIRELEQMNLKNLIDKSLDNRDEELFYELTSKLDTV
ncbi:IDEAL domain-containing protein [Ornithinibacillus sp. 4-3]|uniref:IDEAL domain-containing protein n=1 Tax=Ornithinibacillus sp. 4-3 TaxID=3231488 RepID=A0AB39HTR5_9BACI